MPNSAIFLASFPTLSRSFSIFGGLVGVLAAAFSVTYPPTLVIVAGLLFALVVILSQSVIISTQADRLRDLAQTVALLEWRLRRLERDDLAVPGLDSDLVDEAA